MEKTTTLSIDVMAFSEYPGPRYINQGEASGEEFYHKILNDSFAKAYTQNLKLSVNLDGTAGYASSFLDEAFGNLVFDYTLSAVKSVVILISKEEPDWIKMVEDEVYNDWEGRRKRKQQPKKTVNHTSWFRLDNNELIRKKWI